MDYTSVLAITAIVGLCVAFYYGGKAQGYREATKIIKEMVRDARS